MLKHKKFKNYTFITLLQLVSLFLVFSCSKTLIIYPDLVYCKYDYSIEDLDTRYQNVPIHRGTNLKAFVKDLKLIPDSSLKKYLLKDSKIKHLIWKNEKSQISNPHDLIDKIPVNCSSVFQVFIDEKGQIESIFLVMKSFPFFDSLATEALKQSKFKPLKKVDGTRTPYSVFVVYPIIEGNPIGVFINGISWHKTKSKTRALQIMSREQENTFFIYEVSEPPFLLKAERLSINHPWPKSVFKSFFMRFEYEFVVNEKGEIESIIEKYASNDEWSAEIKKNFYTRRYKPAFLNGKPVKCRLNEIIIFEKKLERREHIPLWDPFSLEMMER